MLSGCLDHDDGDGDGDAHQHSVKAVNKREAEVKPTSFLIKSVIKCIF